MIARSVWRPAMYGGFAGAALGLLLMIAGHTLPNPVLCVSQFVSIIGCGIVGGLVIAFGPRRPLAKAFGLTGRGAAAADLTMIIIYGSLIGLLVGPLAVVVSGFVIGGLTIMAPWRGAHDLFSGAVFGGVASGYFFGLPALAAGAVVGAISAPPSNVGGRRRGRLTLAPRQGRRQAGEVSVAMTEMRWT